MSESMEFTYRDRTPVKVKKPMTLKAIAKEVFKGDRDAYGSFWNEENCTEFFNHLSGNADVTWLQREEKLAADGFLKEFRVLGERINSVIDKDGITASRYDCLNRLQSSHLIVLNSFGVDSRKVIIAAGADETQVLQIAVNYELWDDRDVKKFENQFASKPA